MDMIDAMHSNVSAIPDAESPLTEDALDMVSGGGLITDVAGFAADTVKGGIHYVAKGVGMFLDADQVGGRQMHNFEDKVPALVDKIVNKIL